MQNPPLVLSHQSVCCAQRSLGQFQHPKNQLNLVRRKECTTSKNIFIWKCLMSVGNRCIFPLLDSFQGYLQTQSCKIQKTSAGTDKSHAHAWDMCKELQSSTAFQCHRKPCSFYQCKETKIQYLKEKLKKLPLFPSRNTWLVSGTHLQEGKIKETTLSSTQVLQMMHFNRYTNWDSDYKKGLLCSLATLA